MESGCGEIDCDARRHPEAALRRQGLGERSTKGAPTCALLCHVCGPTLECTIPFWNLPFQVLAAKAELSGPPSSSLRPCLINHLCLPTASTQAGSILSARLSRFALKTSDAPCKFAVRLTPHYKIKLCLFYLFFKFFLFVLFLLACQQGECKENQKQVLQMHFG